MTVRQAMEAEHQLIGLVIDALGCAAESIRKNERVDTNRIRAAAEFMSVFADKLHHGKEEDLLFPRLVKRGVPPDGCTICSLTEDHKRGRILVSALTTHAVRYQQEMPGAREDLLVTLRSLCSLYQQHMRREDDMVFPMAEKVLTEADQNELCDKFIDLDRALGLEVVTGHKEFANSCRCSGSGKG